jgi:hypothetical protein
MVVKLFVIMELPERNLVVPIRLNLIHSAFLKQITHR